jgi:GNAT superfamily N-acetyltransferase
MNDSPVAGPFALERERPALYMVRGGDQEIHPPAVPPEYDLLPLATARWQEARAVVELDGPLPDRAWENLLARVLPGGLFVVRERRSNQCVGTASAVHNPAGSRFYFPAGGELGYLVVDEAHRGRGLGYALVAAVVERFQSAGYQHLWVGVQGWRLAAIRTYLRAGYRPFLHAPAADALAARWTCIFAELGLQTDLAAWHRTLPSAGAAAT